MPITRNCERCGTPVTRPASQMKRRTFCSKSCAYVGLTKEQPTSRRNLFRPGHPLAGVNGYVAEHRVVLYERIGPGTHPCHWCGNPVTWTSRLVGTGHKGMLVADHVNGNGLDNRTENLVPACQGCNAGRVKLIPADEPHVVRPSGKKRRATMQLRCEHCGVNFLRPPRPRPERFCSRTCYYASGNGRRKAQ